MDEKRPLIGERPAEHYDGDVIIGDDLTAITI